MPKKKKRIATNVDPLQILRGKAPPRDVLKRALTDMHAQQAEQLSKTSATERTMAKHLDLAQKTSIDVKDPTVARSVDSLLGMHQKFSKQKLAAPRVIKDVGGLFPGRITVGVIPPYDFDHVLFGDNTGSNVATREASANRLNGRIECSAVTATTGFGGGSAYGVVGLYFHPMGSGRLTVHATPSYSYQWWTNSIRPTALVTSQGSVMLNIYGVDAYADTTGGTGTIITNDAANVFSWREDQTSQVRFDFKSDLQTPVSLSMNVNHTLVYYLFISVHTGVIGSGWSSGKPGSLAGSKLSVAVPSLTYDYELFPVLDPG